MRSVLDIGLPAAAAAKLTAPRLAQGKIRSNQLDARERDVIADLFAVLESLSCTRSYPRKPRAYTTRPCSYWRAARNQPIGSSAPSVALAGWVASSRGATTCSTDLTTGAVGRVGRS